MNEKQLEKKIEWLEAAKRESDKQLKALAKSISKIESSESELQSTMKALAKDLALAKKDSEKIKDLPLRIREDKIETNKKLIEIEREAKRSTADLKKVFVESQRNLEKEMLNSREELGKIVALQSQLKEQANRDSGQDARIANFEEELKVISAAETARQELAVALEENRKSDDKRISEATGIIDAVYQKMETSQERGGQVENAQKKLTRDFQRLIEDQLKSSNKQSEFIQKISSEQMEKNRAWKEWEKSFSTVVTQSAEVRKRLDEIETLDIAINRAQKTFDLLVEKINRRVNELTEIQRLGEQRFRKEWSTFQADTQKKWTSQTLNRQELSQEAKRQRESLAKQIAAVELRFSDTNEQLDRIEEKTAQFLQSLFETVRDSLSENER